MILSPVHSVLAVALLLSACTTTNGMSNQTATGALIGGVTGAALGNAIGDSDRATIAGGLAGAVIGGAIGENPARQERELNQQLDGSGAQITNTGNRLMVVLPEGVTFPTGSAVVNPGFLPELRQIAQSLRNYPNSTVRVVGHTDNVGTMAFNSELSRDRALAVARILINYGVPSNRITYSGRGFAEPVASNNTASGRALNRRVEIVITPTT